MHAWKHWLMGAGFFGFAIFTLMTGGSPWLVGLCVIASGYLFYRAFTDQTGAAGDDLQLAVNFVRDPRETLLDLAVDRLGGNEEEQPANDRPGLLQGLMEEFGPERSKGEEPPAFDPDAAIARYIANRPPEHPAAAETAYRPPVRGFGRKRA
jgi:hypothetical protein